MAIRGLKALLEKTSPGKLVGAGRYTSYKQINENNRPIGPKLRGVAKLLSESVWSGGFHKWASDGRKGSAWRGKDGGLRRGKAVDAQVSRLSKLSEAARRKSKMLKLTKMTFSAMSHHDLTPIGSQRVVLDSKRKLATAIDVICQRGKNELVLVELKCGFAGSRTAPALSNGSQCYMKGCLSKAKDTVLHRHFAQLAATSCLFKSEIGTMRALKRKDVDRVSSVLLYVNEEGSELFSMPEWWVKKGKQLLEEIT